MKHKKTALLSFLLVFNAALYAQSKEVKFLIDTAIVINKEFSIITDSVDWPDLKKQMLQRTNGRNDSADLQNAMNFLYKSLNDPHGSFIYKGKRFGWHPDMPPADDSLEKEFDKGDLIKSQLLQNDMGYLRIPSMSQKYKDSLVIHLNKSLCHLLETKIKA